MFVELGSTADIWRAHIVRGVLASHEIDAVLWHVNATRIYSQGWGPQCIVLVHDDDVEDAIEILQAKPEPIPELEAEDVPAAITRADIYPDIVPSLQAGMILWFTLSIIELAFHFVSSLFQEGQLHSDPSRFSILVGILVQIPILGVAWSILAYLMLLALRVAEEPVKTLVAIVVIPSLL